MQSQIAVEIGSPTQGVQQTDGDVDPLENDDADGFGGLIETYGIFLWVAIGGVALFCLAMCGLCAWCAIKRKRIKTAVTNMGYDDW